MLEKWGVLDKADHAAFEWDNPNDWGRGALKFGMDVAFDPLTWVTGPLGSLTAKGKAAEDLTRSLSYTSQDLAERLAWRSSAARPGGWPRPES